MSVPSSPWVTTVVLNHGDPSDTVECLRALAQSTWRRQELVVVDGGSEPEQIERLAAACDGHRLILLEENLGYAGGNNRGIEVALEHGADFVWIVNPDVEVPADTLERLLEVMAARPDAGILGPRVLNGGPEPRTVWSDGGEVDLAAGGATRLVHSGVPERDLLGDVGVHPTDYVSGAAMLVRRGVFLRIGLLPEEYFLYFEETDFNLRARQEGWEALVFRGARAVHHRRSMGRLPTPYYVYYFVRGRLLFAERFTTWPHEAVVAELASTWIDPWRERVVRLAPHWVETFDRLVAWAIADGRAARGGRRDEVHAEPPARESPDG